MISIQMCTFTFIKLNKETLRTVFQDKVSNLLVSTTYFIVKIGPNMRNNI